MACFYQMSSFCVKVKKIQNWFFLCAAARVISPHFNSDDDSLRASNWMHNYCCSSKNQVCYVLMICNYQIFQKRSAAHFMFYLLEKTFLNEFFFLEVKNFLLSEDHLRVYVLRVTCLLVFQLRSFLVRRLEYASRFS